MAEGATVVINDVDPESVSTTVVELAADPSLSGRAVAGPADITDDAAVRRLLDAVGAEHGPVDILVNNAGGAMPGSRWAPVVDTSLQEWNDFLLLNLTSAFLCSRAVLPTMMAAGWGRIVCVNSISAENGQRAGAGYAAGKAGLVGLVASLAKEAGASGVAVNGVTIGNAPHPTRTPDRQALLDGWVHLGRVGRYDEFAAAIAFLCSDDASYLSGSFLAVDGGFHRFNQL
ncbi:MAG: SDR family oxidoreductase [Acidimicrobiales bacterium]|nr:SDR family oxidoreductase [Acidimicrobiales bacterium]